MKKSLLIFLFAYVSTNISAQAPEKMSYQAVIRNAVNNLVKNTTIGMRISILQGSASGVSVYTETQTPMSNANGLVSIQIGEGIPSSGTFSNIDWSNGPYFISTETDLNGGSNYTITGVSQLLSVPYSLYSKNSNFSQGFKIDTLNSGDLTVHFISGTDITCKILTYANFLLNSMYDQSIVTFKNGVLQSIDPSNGIAHGPFVTGDLIEFKIYIHTSDGIKYYYRSVTI